jgi:hypothetical protein
VSGQTKTERPKRKPRHKVEIDGVPYVPASEAQLAKLSPASVAVSCEVATLILKAYWHHPSELRGRGAGGYVFDALKAVAPGAAEMLEETNDAGEVLSLCFPGVVDV